MEPTRSTFPHDNFFNYGNRCNAKRHFPIGLTPATVQEMMQPDPPVQKHSPVVRFAPEDPERTVDLFQQQDPGHRMRKRHP